MAQPTAGGYQLPSVVLPYPLPVIYLTTSVCLSMEHPQIASDEVISDDSTTNLLDTSLPLPLTNRGHPPQPPARSVTSPTATKNAYMNVNQELDKLNSDITSLLSGNGSSNVVGDSACSSSDVTEIVNEEKVHRDQQKHQMYKSGFEEAEVIEERLGKEHYNKDVSQPSVASTVNKRNNSEDRQSIEIHPMLYYVKQSLSGNALRNRNLRGRERDIDSLPPLQVAFVDGKCNIALPLKKRVIRSEEGAGTPENVDTREGRNRDGEGLLGRVAVTSHPEYSLAGMTRQNNLVYTFLLLGVINFVITCILFATAAEVDRSKIQYVSTADRGALPGVFDEISPNRTSNENAVFAFTILNLFLGMYACIYKWATGLSLYSIVVTIMFVISMVNAPYFVYCFRYLLDMLMLFVGQELRAHLIVNFLSLMSQPVS